MNKTVIILTALSVLAACNTPSLGFYGIEPTTVIVDGSTFDVRVKGLRAEAIRTNSQYAPRMGPIGGRASEAIERASGCKVRSIGGDQALISAVLDCGKGRTPPPQTGQDLECYSVGGLDVSGDDLNDLVLDCTSLNRR